MIKMVIRGGLQKVCKNMISEKIARFFSNARPHIQGNPNLSDPQVEGCFRTRQQFRNYPSTQ